MNHRVQQKEHGNSQTWFQISAPEHSEYGKDRTQEKSVNFFKLRVAHLYNVLELFSGFFAFHFWSVLHFMKAQLALPKAVKFLNLKMIFNPFLFFILQTLKHFSAFHFFFPCTGRCSLTCVPWNISPLQNVIRCFMEEISSTNIGENTNLLL